MLVVLALFALVTALAACSSDDGGEQSTDTTVSPTIPKGTPVRMLCKDEVTDGGNPTSDVERLVANLIRQANLFEAEAYEDYALRCDNTGVTTIEAPTHYVDVEPQPLGAPQTSIRVSPDLSARVEAEPIISFFAAPVGGSQFPTQPGFAVIIQQSADGSLSSGTRDPREGKTISEECQALPLRELSTGDFTGKARFFVNCGDGRRAWVLVAAAPDNGDPYFIQVVAEVLDAADAEAVGRALTTMHVDNDTLTRLTEAQEAAAQTDSGANGGDGTTTSLATTTTTAP